MYCDVLTMVCLCLNLCERERGEKVYCSVIMMVCSCMCLCERGEERRCIVTY